MLLVQGASVFMRQFTNALPEIEEAIFSTKTHRQLVDNATVPCSCGAAGRFRCPECGCADMMCGNCIVKMHPHQLFHHVEVWEGSGFRRTPLIDLGHELHLCHGGRRCPHGSYQAKGQKVVIVDTNGIHNVQVFFCGCHEAPSHHLQLIGEHLFPATLDRPQTAFTFAVLHNFHVHNLVSKKTAQDYYRALQKLTDSAFPSKVPVRKSFHFPN
jgi:hypothetical protein